MITLWLVILVALSHFPATSNAQIPICPSLAMSVPPDFTCGGVTSTCRLSNCIKPIGDFVIDVPDGSLGASYQDITYDNVEFHGTLIIRAKSLAYWRIVIKNCKFINDRNTYIPSDDRSNIIFDVENSVGLLVEITSSTFKTVILHDSSGAKRFSNILFSGAHKGLVFAEADNTFTIDVTNGGNNRPSQAASNFHFEDVVFEDRPVPLTAVAFSIPALIKTKLNLYGLGTMFVGYQQTMTISAATDILKGSGIAFGSSSNFYLENVTITGTSKLAFLGVASGLKQGVVMTCEMFHLCYAISMVDVSIEGGDTLLFSDLSVEATGGLLSTSNVQLTSCSNFEFRNTTFNNAVGSSAIQVIDLEKTTFVGTVFSLLESNIYVNMKGHRTSTADASTVRFRGSVSFLNHSGFVVNSSELSLETPSDQSEDPKNMYNIHAAASENGLTNQLVQFGNNSFLRIVNSKLSVKHAKDIALDRTLSNVRLIGTSTDATRDLCSAAETTEGVLYGVIFESSSIDVINSTLEVDCAAKQVRAKNIHIQGYGVGARQGVSRVNIVNNSSLNIKFDPSTFVAATSVNMPTMVNVYTQNMKVCSTGAFVFNVSGGSVLTALSYNVENTLNIQSTNIHIFRSKFVAPALLMVNIADGSSLFTEFINIRFTEVHVTQPTFMMSSTLSSSDPSQNDRPLHNGIHVADSLLNATSRRLHSRNIHLGPLGTSPVDVNISNGQAAFVTVDEKSTLHLGLGESTVAIGTLSMHSIYIERINAGGPFIDIHNSAVHALCSTCSTTAVLSAIFGEWRNATVAIQNMRELEVKGEIARIVHVSLTSLKEDSQLELSRNNEVSLLAGVVSSIITIADANGVDAFSILVEDCRIALEAETSARPIMIANTRGQYENSFVAVRRSTVYAKTTLTTGANAPAYLFYFVTTTVFPYNIFSATSVSIEDSEITLVSKTLANVFCVSSSKRSIAGAVGLRDGSNFTISNSTVTIGLPLDQRIDGPPSTTAIVFDLSSTSMKSSSNLIITNGSKIHMHAAIVHGFSFNQHAMLESSSAIEISQGTQMSLVSHTLVNSVTGIAHLISMHVAKFQQGFAVRILSDANLTIKAPLRAHVLVSASGSFVLEPIPAGRDRWVSGLLIEDSTIDIATTATTLEQSIAVLQKAGELAGTQYVSVAKVAGGDSVTIESSTVRVSHNGVPSNISGRALGTVVQVMKRVNDTTLHDSRIRLRNTSAFVSVHLKPQLSETVQTRRVSASMVIGHSSGAVERLTIDINNSNTKAIVVLPGASEEPYGSWDTVDSNYATMLGFAPSHIYILDVTIAGGRHFIGSSQADEPNILLADEALERYLRIHRINVQAQALYVAGLVSHSPESFSLRGISFEVGTNAQCQGDMCELQQQFDPSHLEAVEEAVLRIEDRLLSPPSTSPPDVWPVFGTADFAVASEQLQSLGVHDPKSRNPTFIWVASTTGNAALFFIQNSAMTKVKVAIHASVVVVCAGVTAEASLPSSLPTVAVGFLTGLNITDNAQLNILNTTVLLRPGLRSNSSSELFDAGGIGAQGLATLVHINSSSIKTAQLMSHEALCLLGDLRESLRSQGLIDGRSPVEHEVRLVAPLLLVDSVVKHIMSIQFQVLIGPSLHYKTNGGMQVQRRVIVENQLLKLTNTTVLDSFIAAAIRQRDPNLGPADGMERAMSIEGAASKLSFVAGNSDATFSGNVTFINSKVAYTQPSIIHFSDDVDPNNIQEFGITLASSRITTQPAITQTGGVPNHNITNLRSGMLHIFEACSAINNERPQIRYLGGPELLRAPIHHLPSIAAFDDRIMDVLGNGTDQGACTVTASITPAASRSHTFSDTFPTSTRSIGTPSPSLSESLSNSSSLSESTTSSRSATISPSMSSSISDSASPSASESFPTTSPSSSSSLSIHPCDVYSPPSFSSAKFFLQEPSVDAAHAEKQLPPPALASWSVTEHPNRTVTVDISGNLNIDLGGWYHRDFLVAPKMKITLVTERIPPQHLFGPSAANFKHSANGGLLPSVELHPVKNTPAIFFNVSALQFNETDGELFGMKRAKMSFEITYEDGDPDIGVETRLIFPKEAFGCSQKLPFQPNLTFYIAATAHTIPTPVLRGTQQAIIVTAVASGVINSPTLAVEQMKMNSIRLVAQCAFPHTQPLDLLNSMTGLGFGPRYGHFYRGGVIGNIGLMVLISLALFLVGVVGHLFRVQRARSKNTNDRVDEPITFASSLAKAHLPSILLVPASLLIQGTMACSTAAIIHSGLNRDYATNDILIGTLGYVICLGGLGLCFILTTRWMKCELVDSDEVETNPEVIKKRSLLRRFCEFLFESDKHWMPKNYDTWKGKIAAAANDGEGSSGGVLSVVPSAGTSSNHAHLLSSAAGGSARDSSSAVERSAREDGWAGADGKDWKRNSFFLFNDYRFGAAFSIELSSGAIIGIIEGIRISSFAACLAQAWIILVVFLAQLVLCFWLAPALTRLQQIFIRVVSIAGAISAVFLIATLHSQKSEAGDPSATASYRDDSGKSSSRILFEVTETVTFAVSLLGTLKFALDMLFLFFWAASRGKGILGSTLSKAFNNRFSDRDLHDIMVVVETDAAKAQMDQQEQARQDQADLDALLDADDEEEVDDDEAVSHPQSDEDGDASRADDPYGTNAAGFDDVFGVHRSQKNGPSGASRGVINDEHEAMFVELQEMMGHATDRPPHQPQQHTSVGDELDSILNDNSSMAQPSRNNAGHHTFENFL